MELVLQALKGGDLPQTDMAILMVRTSAFPSFDPRLRKDRQTSAAGKHESWQWEGHWRWAPSTPGDNSQTQNPHQAPGGGRKGSQATCHSIQLTERTFFFTSFKEITKSEDHQDTSWNKCVRRAVSWVETLLVCLFLRSTHKHQRCKKATAQLT